MLNNGAVFSFMFEVLAEQDAACTEHQNHMNDFGTLKHWHLSQEFKKWFPQDLDFKGHEFIA